MSRFIADRAPSWRAQNPRQFTPDSDGQVVFEAVGVTRPPANIARLPPIFMTSISAVEG